MKRFFILASAAIVALASCAKTEVRYDNAEPQEIAFKKITGAMTKTTTALEVLNSTMGVYAFYHQEVAGPAAEYFANKKFIEDGSTSIWKGENPYYWPLQGYLDFLVYSPYTESGASYTSNALTLTIPDNSTDQIDWVAGTAIVKNCQYVVDDATDVTLQHLLSKITIQVKSNVEDLFTVKSVVLSNIEKSGEIVVNYATPVTVTPTNDTTGDEYPHTFTGPTGTLTTTLQSCGDHLVFPSTADHVLTVTYTMAGMYSGNDLTATLNLENVVWATGTHYTYNLTLTANEIKLDPIVNAWTVGTVTAVTGNPSIQ